MKKPVLVLVLAALCALPLAAYDASPQPGNLASTWIERAQDLWERLTVLLKAGTVIEPNGEAQPEPCTTALGDEQGCFERSGAIAEPGG